MRVKLVKYLIDASTDKTLGKVFRYVNVPQLPSPPWVVQSREAKFCELVQLIGFDLEAQEWECMSFPAYLAKDQEPEGLVKQAIDAGWTLDGEGLCVVDFEAKMQEEAMIQGLLDPEPVEAETTPVEEGDGTDLEVEPWKKEHDKLFPDTGLELP